MDLLLTKPSVDFSDSLRTLQVVSPFPCLVLTASVDCSVNIRTGLKATDRQGVAWWVAAVAKDLEFSGGGFTCIWQSRVEQH